LRETLKSLSIFSAMLLLLLLVSSGCDVNIPGCGKRSLPFFKQIKDKSLSTALATPPINPISTPPTTVAEPIKNKPITPIVQKTDKSAKSISFDTSIEMSVTKPTPIPTATATATATPVDVEKIAYISEEHGKNILRTMNPDGTDRVSISPPQANCWFPLWSPSGKVLAFLSDMNDGSVNLYTIKKDGTELKQLTSYSDMVIEDPIRLKPTFSWSPRSDEIAFIYHRQIWKIELDDLTQITLASPDPSYTVSTIEWAPHRDTKYVAYLSKKGESFFGLLLVNPRLKDRLDLVEVKYPVADLSWSPDARQIAFIQNHNQIYTASPDTSLPKLIIYNASPELGPLLSYSPVESGSPVLMTLAKQTISDEGYRVAIVDQPSKGDQDPGSLKYLTETGVSDAIWSPDGNKIAYVRDGELWMMDAFSGANKIRIAATGIITPNWSKK
jgi:Tol biopolymer transport system component